MREIVLPEPFHWVDRRACIHQHFEANETVFHQGAVSSGFYIVLSGTVELRRVTDKGRQVVLHRAQAGEAFAEASLFSPHYHCDAMACAASEICTVPKTLALSRLSSDPSFARAFTAHLARQVQSHRTLHHLQAIRRADDRVLAALQAGLSAQDWQSFAGQIGLTREAVYRALNVLVRVGEIERVGRGAYRVL